MILDEPGFRVHDKRCQPQSGGEPLLANFLGQGLDTLRKSRFECKPITDLAFEAVIDLNQLYGQAVLPATMEARLASTS